MSGYRKIVVDGRHWKYKVGKQFCVANAIDNNEKKLINLADLVGVSQAELERMIYRNKTLHVTPGMIAAWLGDHVYEPPHNDSIDDPHAEREWLGGQDEGYDYLEMD